MRKKSSSAVARMLLGACVVAATTGLAAYPASASSLRKHHTTPTTAAPAPAAASVTTLPPPSSPAPAPADNCVKGAWPTDINGRPASFTAGDDGAYLWHDADGGWALRVTHAGAHDRVIFSGTLTSAAGKFIDVREVNDEGNDIVFLSANKHQIIFRFVDYGLVDGLDFATHCASAFRVNIHMSGQLAPVGTIHLGSTAVNPVVNPFRVVRTAIAEATRAAPAEGTTTTTLAPATTPS